MVRQDVKSMLDAVFSIIEQGKAKEALIEIPPIFRENIAF